MAEERTGQWVDDVTAYRIVQMKTDGHDNREIAARLGLNHNTVNSVIREAAQEARKQKSELVDQQYMLHLRRTEGLYEKVYARLTKLLELPEELMRTFHKEIMEAVKVLILILQRQSTLMGLDANKTTVANPYRGQYDWVSDPNVSEDRLVAEARRLGIRLPENFGGSESCPAIPLPAAAS